MKIDKLLIATHNAGKFAEISAKLKGLNVPLYSLDDLHITEDFEETGETFADNAIGKAKFYYELSKLPTLADDSGLCVDALGGMPGVHSRRWDGSKGTDEEILQKLFDKLKGVPLDKRTATFIAVAALYDGRELILARGENKGIFGLQAACPIKEGVPYSSAFYPDGHDRVSSQLSIEEKNKTSHRGRALEELIKKLKQTHAR